MQFYRVINKVTGKLGFIASDNIMANGTVCVIYKGDTAFHMEPLSSLTLDPTHIIDEEDEETASVLSIVPSDETTH